MSASAEAAAAYNLERAHQTQQQQKQKQKHHHRHRRHKEPPPASWKLYENPFYEGLAAAVAAAAEAAAAAAAAVRQDDTDNDHQEMPPPDSLPTSARPFVSARKLAASLWEDFHHGPASAAAGAAAAAAPGPTSSPRSHLQSRPSSVSTSESPRSSSKASKSRSPRPIPSLSPPLKTITLMRPRATPSSASARHLRRSSSPASASSQLSERASLEHVPFHDKNDKYLLTDSALITSPCGYNTRTSTRSRSSEDKQIKDSSPLVSALSDELTRALSRVQELEFAQMSARNEVDGLLKRFADEITSLRNKEQDKIQDAIYSIAEELQHEQKVRRKLETDNRKLSRSLAEVSKAVVKAEKELDKEKKARKLMEEVCEELAREIGEDKAEVEELKREQAKAREEIEEEHRSLLMAEAWREERVQMKLSEAKFELEERCMAFDKLKMELDIFLNFLRSDADKVSVEEEARSLREAMGKLQLETNRSMLLLEDGDSLSQHYHKQRHQQQRVSGHSYDHADDDGDWSPRSLERGAEDARWATSSEKNAKEDSGWNTDSHDVVKEESDCEGSMTGAQDGINWDTRIVHSTRGEVGATESCRSSRTGFGNRSPSSRDEDRYEDDDAGSPLGSRDDWRDNTQGQYSDWSADCEDDNDDTHLTPRSACEEEEDHADNKPSLDFKRMYKLSRRVGRGPRSRQIKQSHSARFQQHGDDDADVHGSSVNGSLQSAEAESEESPISKQSPVYRHHSAIIDFARDWASGGAGNHDESQGRRASIGCSIDWPKSFKSNSLQAKLLLEDRMSVESESQLWHSNGVN